MPSQISFITVSEEYAGQRIDNFLFRRLKGVPKSRLYRALRGGEFRVNKKRISADYRLQVGDEIRVPPLRVAEVPPATFLLPKPALLERMAESVVYEDGDLIIVNKPSGVASHGGSGVHFGVIELFRRLRPQAKFLELVHRLDRGTTGCLMLAKKSSILKELQDMLRARSIDKRYLALVAGDWKEKEKRVEAPLLKQVLSSGERRVKVHPEGKPAVTIFRALRSLGWATLVEARPLTGRTHQIRVHAAHMGHPIVGDDKYAREDAGVKHLLLHAASLTFTLVSKDKRIGVCACLDDEFLMRL